MKKYLIYLNLIFVVLLLASCNKTIDTISQNNIPEKPDFAGQTLSISVCYDHYFLDEHINSFQRLYPGVEIVLNKYEDDLEKYRLQVKTQILAGQADDVLDGQGLYELPINNNGLLADIYPGFPVELITRLAAPRRGQHINLAACRGLRRFATCAPGVQSIQ